MFSRTTASGLVGIATVVFSFAARAGQTPDGQKFWAFQPQRVSPTPDVTNKDWPRSDIDRFVLARLEAGRLEPAGDADRTTLVRRVFFDLVGLPPSVRDIDDVLNPDVPARDAVATLVDRLLESPQFGERWGRHWLDVARYADSTGGGRSLLLHNAWRYRDYVIEAFNRDKPFDQFIREQIAGDLLAAANDAERAEQLTATAFLMIGAHNYELQDKETLRMDVVDEQIEAVGRAFLAQTLGCARCHDHKFDPIPAADYYALAGIFRSTKSLTPGNVSGFEQHELPVSPERRAALDQHAEQVKAADTRLATAKTELKKLQADAKLTGGPNAPGAKGELLGVVVDDADARVVGNWTKSMYNAGYVGEGYIHDGASGKGEKTVTFPVELPHDGMYEIRLSYTHGTNRSPSVPVTIRHADDAETVQFDERQPPPLDGRFIALGRWRFSKGTSDAVTIANEGTTGHVIVDAVQFIPVELLDTNPKREQGSDTTRLHETKTAFLQPAPGNADSNAASRSAASAVKESETKIKQLEADLKKLKDSAPEPPPATMGVKDEKETGDFRICTRGNVHNLGDEVRRGFLTVATAPAAKPPAIAAGESGRRELAEWLASPSNPLTARVTVNRIWHHLFGAGLVRTCDNFGATGETRSHPELLDWLARRFIEQGWSHKKLIREIMLSRVYQTSSAPRQAPYEISNLKSQISHQQSPDPENRLLSHQNRRRLDAECLRDAILSVSGQLDLTPGGPSIREKTQSEYGYAFDSTRRSVYLPIFRNNLPDIFDVFDFADPNTPTGQRNVSTLPSQALFLMNSPFVISAARSAAEDILELDLPDADRLELAYRRTLGRRPTPAERELGLRYFQSSKHGTKTDPTTLRLESWSRFYQALFASIDFRYVY